ncbi:MAG: bifunctional riboflavin kinase/FAD synthetase [Bacteroidetes bacterium]|nr:bifunctional riboflavin kinase/FAD synthetase [Bacteroidota bacterium]
MKSYNHIDEFSGVKNAVVTTGTFDGVHLGHLEIIRMMRVLADACGGETVLLTFFPHPRMVLFPERKQLLLTTIAEKTELLEKAGVAHLIIHPFTREFSMLTSHDFIAEILVKKLHTKKLVIGHDHHFGKDREGSFFQLKSSGAIYGFEVEEIPVIMSQKINISSTQIRNALMSGNVELAAQYLGYDYKLGGTVVKGRMAGRSIDFPTANISVSDVFKIVPADGVYAVKVKRGKEEMKGMMNIGMRPTVNGKERTLEVNIFDFNGDLYGETLILEFVKRMRDEVKFDGLSSLKSQLEKDRALAKEILQ